MSSQKFRPPLSWSPTELYLLISPEYDLADHDVRWSVYLNRSFAGMTEPAMKSKQEVEKDVTDALAEILRERLGLTMDGENNAD